MPDLKSLDNIYLLLAFLAPGLVILFIRSKFTTGRVPSQAEASLAYLAISVIYYAITLPLIEAIQTAHLTGYAKAAAWFGVIFIGPVLLGVILGIDVQKGYFYRFLKRIGLHPVHAIPTAWDWKFGQRTEQWVLVTLKNGTQFAGLLCKDLSFMSSDPKERDIYIGQIYDIDEHNNWTARSNKSLLIASGEISTIEFWPLHHLGDRNREHR